MQLQAKSETVPIELSYYW